MFGNFHSQIWPPFQSVGWQPWFHPGAKTRKGKGRDPRLSSSSFLLSGTETLPTRKREREKGRCEIAKLFLPSFLPHCSRSFVPSPSLGGYFFSLSSPLLFFSSFCLRGRRKKSFSPFLPFFSTEMEKEISFESPFRFHQLSLSLSHSSSSVSSLSLFLSRLNIL